MEICWLASLLSTAATYWYYLWTRKGNISFAHRFYYLTGAVAIAAQIYFCLSQL